MQLFKRDDRIHVRFHFFVHNLGFLCGARSDKDHFCVGSGVLDILGDHAHRREIVRDVRHERREVLLDVGHKRRAAGACQESFLRKLFAFFEQHHIRAECRLDHRVESEFFEPRDHLTEFCVGKLAGNGRSNHRIELVFGVVFAIFDKVDDVENERLVRDCSPRALIHARSALDALGVVDFCRAVFVHGDGFDLASVFARTFVIDDCAVRADFCACAALFALGFVDMRNVLSVKRDCAELAHVFATMRQAGLRNFIAAHRALVASDVDDFDDVGIFFVAAHCELDALCQNGALFVHATTHGGDFARHDAFGDVDGSLAELAIPCFFCHFAKHFVFEMLNFCVENSHIYTYLFFLYAVLHYILYLI